MKNKNKYTALISVEFDCPNGCDPDETADEIVRDIGRSGIVATLDEVVEGGKLDLYSHFVFVKPALECGHGQDFKATFSCRHDGADDFCIESVDISAGEDNAPEYAIGGVGGEIRMKCSRNSDGSFCFEQMCRAWLGVWHRQFFGKTEDSVLGAYLIIRQIVAEGKWVS